MMKAAEVLRAADLYGIRVGLSYKGDMYFRTILGGCCSILLILLFTVYGGIAFNTAFSDPTYLQNPASYTYLNQQISADTWTLDTDYNTVAVKISSNFDEQTQESANKNYRVIF